MKKSSGVVILRIALAVVLLSLIVSCIYYFIIKARDEAEIADNLIFQEYNTTLNSKNVLDISANLGGFESGKYFDYAESQGGLGYKEAYLSLFASQRLLDANKDRLIISKGDAAAVHTSLIAIQDSAQVLMRSIIVYNTSKDAYGTSPTPQESAAILENFKTIVKDLRTYALRNADLARNVFEYTSASYFEGLNPFGSAQYMYSYCLNKQIVVCNNYMKTNAEAMPSDLYTETKLIVGQFVAVSEEGFTAQVTSDVVAEVLGYFVSGVNFDDVLYSEDKTAFVAKITDEASRAKAQKLLVALGLGEGV